MNAPKVGQIEDGYRFKGGDPADTNNWDEVIEDGYKFTGKNESELGNVDAWVPAQTKKPKERFLEESPEDLAWKDRAIVKNFSNNSKDAAAYLQDKYKDHDVTVNEAGDLYMRKKGQTDWKAVDPNTGFFSKDILKDATDIGYDTLAGLGTSAATAAGGIAGAGAGGVGALPTAAFFGGAASGGLETLRQSLGKALGIKQDFDAGNIGMSAAFGAASPFVFGTGASSKQLLEKALANNLDDAGVLALAKSQKGGVGRLYDGVYDWGSRTAAPKVMSLVSGRTQEEIKSLGNRLKDLVGLEKNGIREPVKGYQENVKNAFGKYINLKGRQLESEVGKISGEVDTLPLHTYFQNVIDKLESLKAGASDPTIDAQIEAAKKTYAKYVQGLPEKISTQRAFKLGKDLGDFADLASTGGLGMRSGLEAADNSEKITMEAARFGKEYLNDALDLMSEGKTKNIRNQLAEIHELKNEVAPIFKSPKDAFAKLRGLDKEGKRYVREAIKKVDSQLGTNVSKDAELLQLMSTYSQPATDILSSGGTTSTTRSIPLAAIGSGVGYFAGEKLSDEAGVSGLVGRAIGAGLGGLLGSKAGSPAAIRMYIEKGQALEKAANALRNSAPVRAAPASAWNYIRNKQVWK